MGEKGPHEDSLMSYCQYWNLTNQRVKKEKQEEEKVKNHMCEWYKRTIPNQIFQYFYKSKLKSTQHQELQLTLPNIDACKNSITCSLPLTIPSME